MAPSTLRSFVLAALCLGSLVTQSSAAPTPENILLARRYAPQFRFHKDEIYWPSTVEYFLNGVKARNDKNQEVPQPSPLTNENVDDITNAGSGTFLSVADIGKAKNDFLRGQNPSTGQPKIYTFIAPKNNGVVDLFYWLFTPFNHGKSVPVLGQIGDHVGDWERLTVRTVNGVATQVDYHAHGDTGSGTIPYNQVTKFDNDRPVGYVARGSHGLWAKAGTFTYVNAVIFQLQDVTGDGGLGWDVRDHLVPIGYPETYSGNLDWLDFKGAWGNKGSTSCWWYVFYNGCEIINGPGGPLRDNVLGAAEVKAKSKLLGEGSKTAADIIPKSNQMAGTLSQTLGFVKDGSSEFTVRVDASTAPSDHPFLAVQLRCQEPATEEVNPDGTKPTPAFTTLTQFVPHTDSQTEYKVAVPACSEGTFVTSYVVALCATDIADTVSTDCLFASAERNLRAFSNEADVLGIQQATAVDVDDLDDWEW